MTIKEETPIQEPLDLSDPKQFREFCAEMSDATSKKIEDISRLMKNSLKSCGRLFGG